METVKSGAGKSVAGVDESMARQMKAVRLNLTLDIITVVPVIAVAVLSRSMLLYSDIFDYAKSLMSGFIAWSVLRRIIKGRMLEYDYGPGKMESLAGLIGGTLFMGGLLVMAGFAFHRVFHPVALNTGFTLLGVLFQLVGFGVNFWLWQRNRKLAASIRAPLIEVQWRGNRTEALSNLVVVVALLMSLILKPFPWRIYIDPVCALVFLCYAAGSFIPVLQACVRDLMDKTLEENLQLKIMRHLAENFEGYEVFHGIRSRRSGGRVYIEVTLGFNPEKTVGEAMDTADRLRQGIERDIQNSEVGVVFKSPERINVPRLEKTEIQILPLSSATLGQALELVRSTFNLTADEKPDLELEESLYPGRHTAALAKVGISDPRYWIAFYKNKVVGLAGFYFRPDDRHEAVWGGWTVYDANSRTGFSRARFLLLRRLVIEAEATGRKYFRLYTSTAPVEQQANRFYDRVGLKVYKTEPLPDGKTTVLYRQVEVAKVIKLFKL